MNKNKLYVLAALAIVGIIVGRVYLSQDEDEAHVHDHEEREIVALDEAEAEQHGIILLEAGPCSLEQVSILRGKVFLEPQHRGSILANVTGNVKETWKNRGDHVRSGEIVAILESREVAEAKAEFLAAAEREKCLSAIFEGEAKLHEKGVSAAQDYLHSRYDLEEARINLKLAKQKLLALNLSTEDLDRLEQADEKDLRLYEVKASREGTVIKQYISPGEYVDETTPLFDVADLRKASIEMGIYPKDLEILRVGQEVEVKSLQGSQQGEGRLTYISPIVDEATMSCKGIACLDNKNKQWRPGSYVKVLVKSPASQVSVGIDKEAVQLVEGQPTVFVKIPEGFLKREVVLGIEDDKHVEVISGLEKGEKYASGQIFILKADLGKDSLEHED